VIESTFRAPGMREDVHPMRESLQYCATRSQLSFAGEGPHLRRALRSHYLASALICSLHQRRPRWVRRVERASGHQLQAGVVGRLEACWEEARWPAVA